MAETNLQSRYYDQKYSILRQKSLSEIYDEIAEVYLSNSLPWVIGFSGGKDSTATLQLVWYALKRLPPEKLTKHVYVVASDTLVEAPAIAERIDSSLRRMNEAAHAEKLRLTAHKVTPDIDESFWVNLIGRGYPAPYNRFRWCTDRMKIKPTNRFVKKKVTEHGEVVVVLGVRKAESFTREQVINLHKITGSRLARHSMLPGAYVYTPIEDFTVKDVWDYLFLEPNPWGADNMSLRELYESADGECPLVIDTLTPSCGNTRFGCWVCTVVEKDRSMEAMVESGDEWMTPMLEYRDFLVSTQDPANKQGIRSLVRRDGQVWIKNGKLIYGPYDFEFRQELLRRLLRAQQQVRELSGDSSIVLIQTEELHAIRRIWRSEENDWTDVLPQIYEEETGETLDWVQDDTSIFGTLEESVLTEVCQARGVSPELVKQLLYTEQEYYGMRRRHQIYTKIDSIFKRDWRSNEEILSDLADDEITHPTTVAEMVQQIEVGNQ
ncbi:DNA phosphorothioation system sulfurtransferase DndC [Chloroflexota bacterium]